MSVVQVRSKGRRGKAWRLKAHIDIDRLDCLLYPSKLLEETSPRYAPVPGRNAVPALACGSPRLDVHHLHASGPLEAAVAQPSLPPDLQGYQPMHV